MRRCEGGAGVAPAGRPRKQDLREALGHRPLLLRRAARKGWTRQGEREESARARDSKKVRPSRGSTVPEPKVATMERRKASIPIARDAPPQGGD